MTMGECIREKRKQLGITQTELAKRLGVSSSMINQYEKGNRNPKPETIKKISRALGCTPFDLLGNLEIESIDSQKTPELLSYIHDLASDEAIRQHNINSPIIERIETSRELEKLNLYGIQKVNELIELLLKIPEYRHIPFNHKKKDEE